ncbi:hypothetical protein [Flavobacterium sp. GCM10027622]|uniref:hypothetical protein n=1 Tax=unclassified Flavobacterium TaxID=196869 RepID=UPI00361DAC18
MKIKLIAFSFLFLFLLTSDCIHAQLLQWNTFGNTGTETTEPSVSNNANILPSNLIIGGGVSPAANGNRFGGNNWFDTGNTVTGSSLTEAMAGNNYIEFTVTPNSGFSFTPTSFSFSWDKSGTGPQNVALRSSIDGYSSNIGVIAPTAPIGTFNVITITGLLNITSVTTFRIYGYGATGTGGTGGFDIASNINNIILNGTTASSVLPNISVSASSLSNFTYVVGLGPSAEQNFEVSGSNLTANLTLNAPTDYEISTTSGVGFSSSVSLTSTSGTVASTSIFVRLKSGLALGNYNSESIICSSTGATNQSVICSGSVTNPSTVFSKGDFAVIGINSNISCYAGGYAAGDDEISFITFKAIQNGDSFYITDNGYERTSLGAWGDTEGVYQLTRTGSIIPAGTVVTIRLKTAAPNVEFVSPDANWAYSKPTGFTGSVVLNSGGDQIFFMQGGSWNNPAGANDAIYTPGNYLYAFNTATTWESLGASTQKSGLPIDLQCFSLAPGSATDFLEYTGPTTAADKLEWIARLNNSSNWTNRISCAGYLRTHVGQLYVVTNTGIYSNGIWTGTKNTDWFDCSNWQTLNVPDNTIDVELNGTYAVRDAIIDISSTNASIYGGIAKSKNLTISTHKVQLESDVNNKLEVYGDFSIIGTGSLDMDDANNSTADGQLYLHGNWTNNVGNVAFYEGNGTVLFSGTTPQIINTVTPEGTETFYNVVLNNHFTTSVSNDLLANGDLTINASKTVTISSNDYIQVGKNVVNNGTLTIQDDGSLLQVDDAGTYSGSGSNSLTRVAENLKLFDYVYWSSPQNNSLFATIPNSRYYEWVPDYANPIGYGYGNWFTPSGSTMTNGKGYIFRVPNGNPTQTVTFTGSLFNTGVITSQLKKGPYTSATVIPPGVNGPITSTDDNWNLLGNPYPSAIDAIEFASDNSGVLENGEVSLWRHLTGISDTILSPYYQSFVYNYTSNDYVTYNASGSVPAGAFDGKIASGQAFFVRMKDDVAVPNTSNAVFNNSQRSRIHNNSQFFRTTNTTAEVATEKHRIWLDLVNPNNRATSQMIGYVEGATNADDFLYEAKSSLKSGFQFYSLIADKIYKIQGRQLPFDQNDTVPLGVIVPTDGNYTIAINSVDGRFAEGNLKIYLEDKWTGVIHDLKASPYQFNVAKGNYTNRFLLRYQEQRLSDEDYVVNDTTVRVFVTDEVIKITSDKQSIHTYEVYNLLGQLLKIKTDCNALEVNVSDFGNKNQALIVKVLLDNGTLISKKIIF